QYAQGCNLFAQAGAEVLKHKLNVLREHCERLGRDYSKIERTTLAPFLPTQQDKFLENCAMQAELGIDTVIVYLNDPTDRKAYEALAEVAPKAEKIKVAGRA